MQNLTILASGFPEISLWASKFQVGHVTLTTLLLSVICLPYAGTDIAIACKIGSLYLQPFRRYGWCPPKFKWFRWPDYTPFRDDLPSIG